MVDPSSRLIGDDVRLFCWVIGATFIVTSLFPIGLMISVPFPWAWTQFGVEVSWTIHTWLIMPLAVGATVVAFHLIVRELKLFLYWPAGIVATTIIAIILLYAVASDAHDIPAPIMITSVHGNPVQEFALQVDRCMRQRDDCGKLERGKVIADVTSCLINSKET